MRKVPAPATAPQKETVATEVSTDAKSLLDDLEDSDDSDDEKSAPNSTKEPATEGAKDGGWVLSTECDELK